MGKLLRVELTNLAGCSHLQYYLNPHTQCADCTAHKSPDSLVCNYADFDCEQCRPIKPWVKVKLRRLFTSRLFRLAALKSGTAALEDGYKIPKLARETVIGKRSVRSSSEAPRET